MKKLPFVLLCSALLLSACGGDASSNEKSGDISSPVSASPTEVVSADSSPSQGTSGASSSNEGVSSTSSSSEEISASVSASELPASTVYLLGDSTMASFSDPYYYPRYGYGTQIASYFSPKLNFVNLALSGRSSKSFLSEVNYQTFTSSLKEGDYVIIGFGHNDEKAEAERYTNPNGDVTSEGSFQKSLYDHYCQVALAAKATPILATPIVRRNAANLYEANNAVHVTSDALVGTTTYPGGDYPAAIRSLASAKALEMIDLTALSKEQWSKVGAEENIKYHAWTSDNAASVDNTHLNLYGAQIISYLFASALHASSYPLKAYLNDSFAFPAEATYHVSNPAYVHLDYSAPTSSSTHWQTTSPWWASVFGDCGGASKVNDDTKFMISENSADKSVSLMANATGKLTGSAGDGLAMYFQKIGKEENFTLSAKAHVESLVTSDNQVAFGLMLRDDMYIDSFLGSVITGDYLATGAVNMKSAPCAIFSKTSGALAKDLAAASVPAVGDEIALSISRQGDSVLLRQGSLSYSYAEKSLTGVDADNDYVGLFVARNAKIRFSDIVLSLS